MIGENEAKEAEGVWFANQNHVSKTERLSNTSFDAASRLRILTTGETVSGGDGAE